MSDARYHIRFRDEASADELGLLLVESPAIGFNKRLVNPYAAKGSTGDTQDSDLTEWSVVSFRDWRGGRGQEQLVEKARFLDAWNVESRIEGQLTLGPLPQNPVESLPVYEPGSVSGDWEAVGAGWPRGPLFISGNDDGEFRVQGGGYLFAQKIRSLTAGSFDYRVTSIEVKIRKVSPNQDIRLALYSDSGNLPDTELVYVEVAAADVGTEYAWITFTFSAPYVSSDSYYWIVVSTTASSGYYELLASTGNLYGGGSVKVQMSGGNWHSFGDYDFYFKVHYAGVAMAQSFTAPAGGLTCDRVYVYGMYQYIKSDVTFKLCSDNAGAPGTVLKTKVVEVDEALWEWIKVEWASGQALTGSATYWITAEHASEQGAQYMCLHWYGDADGEYGSGASMYKVASGSWTARTGDLFFRVNDVTGLDGNPVAFARYDGKWYVGAGDTVYVWDEAGSEWDVSDAQAADVVTSMEVWGGLLWVARGTACYLRTYNGTSWSNHGTVYAQLLKGGGGYLHRTDPTSQNELYYTVNGSTWSSVIYVGQEDFPITGMEWFRDMLVCATSVALWGVAAEIAYPVLEWSSQEDADNGRNMLYWSKTGCLYIPLAYGVYRWNGDTMVAVGPEQGTGLPAGRDGKVAALVGTGNWLYAAVDGGASGKSSVLAYGGMGGWHEMQRSEQDGQRIQAIGFETVSSPSQLWLGLGTGTRYLMLPDTSDNPFQWSGYEFNAGGELITSWLGGELLEVVKDLHQVVVRGEDFSSGQTVTVYYEVDRSGRWTYLGEVDAFPRCVLDFEESAFATKTIGSGSTRTIIELSSGDTTDMTAGDWVRFGESGEVAQVASITDSDTFVLETAVENAPESGGYLYASGPAGREFRIKLILNTTSKTSTPKITAVFLRYQNNVLDRFVYSLQVRVQDDLIDLAGNPYPHTAADLRVALDEWAQRARSFTMYDPDGVAHTVKVTSVGEGGWARRQSEGQVGRYASVYSMNVVEVA